MFNRKASSFPFLFCFLMLLYFGYSSKPMKTRSRRQTSKAFYPTTGPRDEITFGECSSAGVQTLFLGVHARSSKSPASYTERHSEDAYRSTKLLLSTKHKVLPRLKRTYHHGLPKSQNLQRQERVREGDSDLCVGEAHRPWRSEKGRLRGHLPY